MPFTSTVPGFSMPQSIWSKMQQASLVVPVTTHVVPASQCFNTLAPREKCRQPTPRPTPSEPPITVFVGNISEKVSDTMIKHILATCGNIASWKSAQGFGYCEYYQAEGALFAIKCLHDMEIGSKKLVVKVDTKAQKTLDQFKVEKERTDDSEKNQKFEVYCRQRINSIIIDHNDEMPRERKQNEPSIVDSVGFDISNEDQKKRIFQEIYKFREVMNQEEINKVETKKKQKIKLNGRHRSPARSLGNSEKNRRIHRREEQDKRYNQKEERDKKNKRDREKKEREKRIWPWVNKKIIEYFGEPEPSLVNCIYSKVVAGNNPQAIINDVQVVLDKDAELFVVKMWRLLVYEVEIRKLKLVELKENGHKDS